MQFKMFVAALHSLSTILHLLWLAKLSRYKPKTPSSFLASIHANENECFGMNHSHLLLARDMCIETSRTLFEGSTRWHGRLTFSPDENFADAYFTFKAFRLSTDICK